MFYFHVLFSCSIVLSFVSPLTYHPSTPRHLHLYPPSPFFLIPLVATLTPQVLSITDPHLSPVSTMLDIEDEVNIAQFHPLPGVGIVYGTKRGKVKIFRRGSCVVHKG